MTETADGDNSMVLMFEPQCCGVEHAAFNAALLSTVLSAFPGAPVLFLAEPAHRSAVQEELALAPANPTSAPGGRGALDRVEWSDLHVPSRGLRWWSRIGGERRVTRQVLRALAQRRCRFALACSLTDTGLTALRWAVGPGPARRPIVAVIHSVLSTVAGPPSRWVWRRPLELARQLRGRRPKGLRCIALGEPIHEQLSTFLPDAARQMRVLPLPYHWAEGGRSPADPPGSAGPIRFGLLGSGPGGFEAFGKIAESCVDLPTARFVHVGRSSASLVQRYERFVDGAGTDALAIDEYRARAASLTYVVWTADPSHYRLTASASFLDALSFAKPGVYLRNPFVEYYFRQMGDIGYLCDNLEAVRATVRSLAAAFPVERYCHQRQNILSRRSLFEPPVLAPRLRQIVEELEVELRSSS